MLVKSKIIKTKTSEIWIDDRGILNLKTYEGAELNYEEVKNCFDVYRELGIGSTNKVLQLISSKDNFNITKEGREYAAKYGKDFFIASAVVTDNLAVRLLANFFRNFYKFIVPFKIFESEGKAVDWLLRYRK